jgi:hypothetical protein
MRVMATISIPVEAGNRAITEGSLPKVIQETANRWSPEAMYFTASGGKRTAFVVFEMPDSSALPAFAEPFFSQLKAEIEIAPVMNPDDLQKGLSALGS